MGTGFGEPVVGLQMEQQENPVKWRKIMNQTIKGMLGQIYRHFKGRLYQVIGIAEHTETGEPLVIYQALYGTFKLYARPYEMFASEVDRSEYSVEEYPQQYQFEPVELTTCEEGAERDNPNGDPSERITGKSLVKAGEHVLGSALGSDVANSDGVAGRKMMQTGQEFLMAFLETDSYREKLDILQAIGNDCTEAIVNSMALSLDMGLKGNSMEECKEEIRQSLMLHMKYEGRRN